MNNDAKTNVTNKKQKQKQTWSRATHSPLQDLSEVLLAFSYLSGSIILFKPYMVRWNIKVTNWMGRKWKKWTNLTILLKENWGVQDELTVGQSRGISHPGGRTLGGGSWKSTLKTCMRKELETLLALIFNTRCVISPTALTDHALSILKALADTTRTTWKKAWKRSIKAEGDCYLATGKCDQFSMTKLDKEEIQQVALSQGICTSIPSRTKKHWKSGDLELTR